MTQDGEPKWEAAVTARVGSRIAELREQTGQSAKAVADRTNHLGHPVSRNSIVDLELGRRASISVAQLTVLAEVLDVAPLELLYPPEVRSLEYLPEKFDDSTAALDWFAGLNRERVRLRRDLAALVKARRRLGLRRVVEKATGDRDALPYDSDFARYDGVDLDGAIKELQGRISALEDVRPDGG